LVVPDVEGAVVSEAQHITALSAANRVRIRRAKDRRDINALSPAEGLAVCADILETLPDHWARATSMELIQSVKRVGRYYALSILRRAGVPESRRLNELTARQRSVLADTLRTGERVAA
jgi:hypothetical protein